MSGGLMDLLKEGVAIRYDKERKEMLIWADNDDAETLIKLIELIKTCFGVEAGNIKVAIPSVRGYKLRLKFPYTFEDVEAEEVREEEEEVELEGWYKLTDSIRYRVDGDEIVIGYIKDGKVSNLARISIEELERLYSKLPDEADSNHIRALVDELNFSSLKGLETYILRLFSQYAKFGGELMKVGKKLVLIKDGGYLREETRRKLSQEAQVIGTPWEV